VARKFRVEGNIFFPSRRDFYDFESGAPDDDFWTEMETEMQNFSVVTTSHGGDGDEEQTMVVVDVQGLQN
jgi:hypothetical protein